VAGTNGKGSTCRFTADMLIALGYKTALFTSPHILKVNERIVLNGKDITDADFDRIFNSCLSLVTKHKLSYFETLTLCAFIYFAEQKPDFSVIETGMGGRYDSSNVLNNKLPVITTIAKDHSTFLGNNIYQITDEKLAIIKDNPSVIVGINPPSITSYINQSLSSKHIILTDNTDNSLPSPFNRNYSLAKNIIMELVGRLPNDFTPTLPQCRLERLGNFILDGAHNPNGMCELMKSPELSKVGAVILSSTADRDLQRLVSLITPRFKNIIITEIPSNERSLRLPVNIPNTIQEKDLKKAINIAVELAKNADILVCGSLYLCAAVKQLYTVSNNAFNTNESI
jgi:dihydrofolate synthase/folylpolyglutamate synthase